MRNPTNKIYVCDACKYAFQYEGDSLPSRRPDCGHTQYIGHPAIRKAEAEEIAEYWRIQKELEDERAVEG